MRYVQLTTYFGFTCKFSK